MEGNRALARSKLLVATRNPGKMQEYRQLLQEIPFELVSLEDIGVSEEVEETGLTFAENASLKARAYSILGGLLTLADDSGLEVDALNGEPGIHSARYGEIAHLNHAEKSPQPPFNKGGLGGFVRGQEGISDQDRVRLLLRNLEGVPWARRTARFRCVIAIANTPGKPLIKGGIRELTLVVGAVSGMIQYEPIGKWGFGYDPVFYLPSHGLTMAQLPLEEKNRISHRANAAGKAIKVLTTV